MLGKMYTKNGQRFPENVRYGDILKGLPLAPRTCKGIYASHVLEHLALDHFHLALDNTRRILGDGGIFRLVVPDLALCARQYLAELATGSSEAAHNFLSSAHLGRVTTRPGLAGHIHRALNRSNHLWMWDAPAMMAVLDQHGFTSLRQCQFGDCEDPMFSLVEDERRFAGAVAIEARA